MATDKIAELIQIKKAKNGYIVQEVGAYGANGDPEIFSDYGDAVEALSMRFGETAFGTTVKQSQAMAEAMTQICSSAVAPKLLAIEAKIKPGIENFVSDDEIEF